MAYCTLDDLMAMLSESEIAQLSAETGEVPDAEIVAAAIAAADALIDGYCEPRYGSIMPFSPVPEIIKAMSVDIAIYNLFSRRTIMPEVRRLKYEDAISFLKRIAQGLANISGTSSTGATTIRWYAV